MDINLARRFFLRTCCTPPIPQLVGFEEGWPLPSLDIIVPHDSLIGKYVSPNPYDKETYFSVLGIYTYFNRKEWRLIPYSNIDYIDMFPDTDDYFFNATNPFFVLCTKDRQKIPLYIRPVLEIGEDGMFFHEILRIERLIKWGMFHASKE